MVWQGVLACHVGNRCQCKLLLQQCSSHSLPTVLSIVWRAMLPSAWELPKPLKVQGRASDTSHDSMCCGQCLHDTSGLQYDYRSPPVAVGMCGLLCDVVDASVSNMPLCTRPCSWCKTLRLVPLAACFAGGWWAARTMRVQSEFKIATAAAVNLLYVCAAVLTASLS